MRNVKTLDAKSVVLFCMIIPTDDAVIAQWLRHWPIDQDVVSSNLSTFKLPLSGQRSRQRATQITVPTI